jgi:hypothetical protein
MPRNVPITPEKEQEIIAALERIRTRRGWRARSAM